MGLLSVVKEQVLPAGDSVSNQKIRLSFDIRIITITGSITISLNHNSDVLYNPLSSSRRSSECLQRQTIRSPLKSALFLVVHCELIRDTIKLFTNLAHGPRVGLDTFLAFSLKLEQTEMTVDKVY